MTSDTSSRTPAAYVSRPRTAPTDDGAGPQAEPTAVWPEPADPESVPAPLTVSASVPAPTRTATVSSPWRVGFGVAVLLLGVLLGVSDQQAEGTGMLLRVPALIAALIMAAQGVQLILRGLPRQTEVEVVEVVDETDPAHPQVSVRPWAAGVEALRTDPGPAGLSALVIVLSVCLGLADLRVDDAPGLFSGLSMLSAFVLFAIGWTLLPQRR